MSKNLILNKKHKGIKKVSRGMGFGNFGERIKSLVNFETFEKPPAKYKEVSRFYKAKGEMIENKQ